MVNSCNCHLVIVGAQKAGTTWMHNTLEYQDNFFCPKDRQEVHFFDRYYDMGYEKYEEKYKKCQKDKITFDVTPAYLCHPLVPKRISAYDRISSRKVKIIISLRNPVKRAISAYKMKVNKGGYKEKLSEAIRVDTSLVGKSKYLNAIKKYINYFDGENIKIFIMEELFNDTDSALNEIKEFVNYKNKIVNIYRNTRLNKTSGGETPLIARATSRALRKLGAGALVHRVKRSRLANLLRTSGSHNFQPVVDSEGVEMLKERLNSEAKAVAELIDRPELSTIWDIE
jgi:hypothetical protein